jgi:hypothetical protein
MRVSERVAWVSALGALCLFGVCAYQLFDGLSCCSEQLL